MFTHLDLDLDYKSKIDKIKIEAAQNDAAWQLSIDCFRSLKYARS